MRSAIVLVLLAASCSDTPAPASAPAVAKPYPRYTKDVSFELVVHDGEGPIRDFQSGVSYAMDGELPSDLPQEALVEVERADGQWFEARVRTDERSGRALVVMRDSSTPMPHLVPGEKVRVVPLGRIPGHDDAPRDRRGVSDVVPLSR